MVGAASVAPFQGGRARLGVFRYGLAWSGRAVGVRHGLSGSGRVWHGGLGVFRCGEA